MIGGTWSGHVGDEALTISVVHVEGLVGERHRADERVLEGPVAGRTSDDVVNDRLPGGD